MGGSMQTHLLIGDGVKRVPYRSAFPGTTLASTTGGLQ